MCLNADGASGVKSKRTRVQRPVWACMLGGNSETRSPALSEMPVTGNRAGVTQRQRPRVAAVGRAGHNPFAGSSSELGTPSIVPGGPSVAVTFQGVSLCTPLHPHH